MPSLLAMTRQFRSVDAKKADALGTAAKRIAIDHPAADIGRARKRQHKQ
jgi:hypothetical protein